MATEKQWTGVTVVGKQSDVTSPFMSPFEGKRNLRTNFINIRNHNKGIGCFIKHQAIGRYILGWPETSGDSDNQEKTPVRGSGTLRMPQADTQLHLLGGRLLWPASALSIPSPHNTQATRF